MVCLLVTDSAGHKDSQPGFMATALGSVCWNGYDDDHALGIFAGNCSICPFFRVGFLNDRGGIVHGLVILERESCTGR